MTIHWKHDVSQAVVTAPIVKHSRITPRRQPRRPKGFSRKSTGLCKCGAERHNPKDAYCKDCRKAASADHRAKAREELKRLRALEQQSKLSKGNDNGQGERRGNSTS